jgi:catechol 2,3-dioxygenase-like lactoylglutathione lyase family enzyme
MTGYRVIGLDHVQLAMPPGQESVAEAFYGEVLGFVRIPKPEPMASRGGCWFSAGPVALHLGVEADFRPARKAHPALVVHGLAALTGAAAAHGFAVRPNPDQPDGAGCYIDDPFGNRIELIDAEWVDRRPATNEPVDQ